MDTRLRYRHLPHWDVPGATYFITSCLAGSIPAQGLLDVANYRRELERRECPIAVTSKAWEQERRKLIFNRTDDWLDSEPIIRHFQNPRLAQVVVDSLFHFAEQRYDLLAYVVMPSHLHWVFQPAEGWVSSLGEAVQNRPPRERIMHSLKTYVARECNHLLKKSGTFWQDESYDHCVRDEAELRRIIEYVEQNPVKAGLATEAAEWTFSSSRLRPLFGIECGKPIKKEHRV